jgi:hypothetical protein
MPLDGNKEDLKMTIYEFLETLNDNYNTVFTLFDCNSEDLVFMATEEAENTCEFGRNDLLYSDYADYNIYGMDMWVNDNGMIHIEFNIEVEEDEYDDEEDF